MDARDWETPGEDARGYFSPATGNRQLATNIIFTMQWARSFTQIAPYYDQLMSQVDYEAWCAYITELFAQARRPVLDVLDLACGTGNLTQELLARGYRVVGLDSSEEMLAVAKEKLPGVEFFRGDFLSWGLDRDFDAVACVYDSLNNLLLDDDMISAFRETLAHLRPGGIFVFDLNTLYGLKRYWGDSVKVNESDGLLSVWRTRFIKPDISELRISVFVEEGGVWKRLDELHIERGYTPSRILKFLGISGFKRARAFQHMTTLPPTRKTGRITFLAIK
ncbi:MAG: class I SAM-dependent methyltransferase [candidate division WOR-3 bacterium]